MVSLVLYVLVLVVVFATKVMVEVLGLVCPPPCRPPVRGCLERWPCMMSLTALLACAQLSTSVSVLVSVSQRIGSDDGGVGGGDREKVLAA